MLCHKAQRDVVVSRLIYQLITRILMNFYKFGTEGNPIQELTHGVTVSNKWMDQMIAGDPQKREIWAKLIQRRVEIGYPYIFFTDTVNSDTVDVYKDKKIKDYS